MQNGVIQKWCERQLGWERERFPVPQSFMPFICMHVVWCDHSVEQATIWLCYRLSGIYFILIFLVCMWCHGSHVGGTLTKECSLASIVLGTSMATMSLYFESPGIDCKPSIHYYFHIHYKFGYLWSLGQFFGVKFRCEKIDLFTQVSKYSLLITFIISFILVLCSYYHYCVPSSYVTYSNIII